VNASGDRLPSPAWAASGGRAVERDLLGAIAIAMCDARDLTDSLTRILGTVCTTTEWHYGRAWLMSSNRLVELVATWDESDSERPIHARAKAELDAQSSRVAQRVCLQRWPGWSSDLLEDGALGGGAPSVVLGVAVLADEVSRTPRPTTRFATHSPPSPPLGSGTGSSDSDPRI